MSWCVVLKINKVPYLYAEQMCSKGLAFHRTVELRWCRSQNSSYRRSCHCGAEIQLSGVPDLLQNHLVECSLQAALLVVLYLLTHHPKLSPQLHSLGNRHSLTTEKAKTNDSVRLPSVQGAGGSRAIMQVRDHASQSSVSYHNSKRKAWRSY